MKTCQFGNQHFFIIPYLLYACGPHITSAQEAGVILSLRQSRSSAQTLKSFWKRFSFPYFPHQFTRNELLLLEEGGGWKAEVSSWFLALKVSWGEKWRQVLEHSQFNAKAQMNEILKLLSGSFAHRKKEMFRK